MPFIRFSRELSRGLTARLRSLRRDTAGAVAAVVAVSAPVLIGSMGLGGEAGYWYLKQRSLQNAADVAAHASAMRLAAGDDSAALQAVAEYIAEQSDIDLDNADLALYNPPINGGFIEDGDAIEIVITESVPRLFSAMYSNEPIQISARAVATAQGGSSPCILALSEVSGGQGIDIADNAVVSAIMCDLVSNEPGDRSVEIHTGAFVSSNCVRSTGDVYTDGLLNTTCPEQSENASPMADPFAAVVEPSMVGACQDKLVENTTVTPGESHPSGMDSIRYCSGLEIKGNVTLNPGLYLVSGGDLIIDDAANLTANGVMFFLAEDVQMEVKAASVLISPPTTGTYAGMTVFGSRSASGRKHVFNGTAGSTLDGAVYASTSRLEFFGELSTSFTGCSRLVGNDIEFKNTASYMMHCLFPTGLTDIGTIGMEVAIVE